MRPLFRADVVPRRPVRVVVAQLLVHASAVLEHVALLLAHVGVAPRPLVHVPVAGLKFAVLLLLVGVVLRLLVHVPVVGLKSAVLLLLVGVAPRLLVHALVVRLQLLFAVLKRVVRRQLVGVEFRQLVAFLLLWLALALLDPPR